MLICNDKTATCVSILIDTISNCKFQSSYFVIILKMNISIRQGREREEKERKSEKKVCEREKESG